MWGRTSTPRWMSKSDSQSKLASQKPIINYATTSPPKSLKNKGVQVNAKVSDSAKAELVNKIESAIQVYNNELAAVRHKYEHDLAESGQHILNLQNINERLTKDHRDKDRLIVQLKNNLALMEDQISDLKRDKLKLRDEVDFLKNNGFQTADDLRKNMVSMTDNEHKIKECKDKIFKFLINERNKGADKTRIDFYKSIINLLMLASDSEKDSSFDFKSLMNYFTREGQKHFGPGYNFHNINREDLMIEPRFDPDFENEFDRSVRKHNKSETRPASVMDFKHGISSESIKWGPSQDVTWLTEIGSNKSQRRKKGKKKTIVLENKVKELTDAIEKQKAEVKMLQEKLKQNVGYTPRAQRSTNAMCSSDRFSQVHTERPTYNRNNYNSQVLELQNIKISNLNEDLLQYLNCVSKVIEGRTTQQNRKTSSNY